MSVKPTGSTAVMARRLARSKDEAASNDTDPRAALDFFPTPPWATRAFFAHAVRGPIWRDLSCWEPCCGEGHMAAVLAEEFGQVDASDVYPHAYGRVGAFAAADGLPLGDVAAPADPADWIITNPPFSLAAAMIDCALREAREGVAMLLRTAFLETDERYQLFSRARPRVVAQFAERVPMTQYRWDPSASTATAYAWFVWMRDDVGGPWHTPEVARAAEIEFPLRLIPPGCRTRLTRPEDAARFGGPRPAGLLDGGRP